MAKYKYRATDLNGKSIRGVRTAVDENELYEKLKQEGQYLTQAKEVETRRKARAIRKKDLAGFCRELGTLLSSGVSLVRALSLISKNDGLKEKERAVYEEVLRRIRQGQPLSDAMESLEGVFPTMMINLIRAAEAAGNMDQTALRLSEHYTKEYRLETKIKSSMTYPKLLGVLLVLVVTVLVGYVLPQFESLFSLMDELPLPTRILYGITNFCNSYWYVVIFAVIAGGILLRVICSIEAVRLLLDRTKLRLPLIGKLWKVIYTARFARGLCSLYAAGISIVTAMQIARNSIGNTWVERQFDKAIATVRGGGTLSDAIDPIDGFISKLAFSIRVGEETGSLDVMLSTTADDLEFESEQAINKMVSYLEPAMIVIMAVVVGFVMIAVMMPIYASYTAIESSAYN